MIGISTNTDTSIIPSLDNTSTLLYSQASSQPNALHLQSNTHSALT